MHASRALDVYTAAPTLFLANDHTGHTELCSLFLDQAYRHGKNGALLAKSRLLFIAEFAERFAPKVIAELRGRLDADGTSPFWEGLGRHFFAMEYSTADYLTGIGQKSFIAELMPKHPVYVNLLPDARARRDRRGARRHARRRARCSSRKASATKATSTSSTPGPTSNAFATTSTRCASRRCCR